MSFSSLAQLDLNEVSLICLCLKFINRPRPINSVFSVFHFARVFFVNAFGGCWWHLAINNDRSKKKTIPAHRKWWRLPETVQRRLAMKKTELSESNRNEMKVICIFWHIAIVMEMAKYWRERKTKMKCRKNVSCVNWFYRWTLWCWWHTFPIYPRTLGTVCAAYYSYKSKPIKNWAWNWVRARHAWDWCTCCCHCCFCYLYCATRVSLSTHNFVGQRNIHVDLDLWRDCRSAAEPCIRHACVWLTLTITFQPNRETKRITKRYFLFLLLLVSSFTSLNAWCAYPPPIFNPPSPSKSTKWKRNAFDCLYLSKNSFHRRNSHSANLYFFNGVWVSARVPQRGLDFSTARETCETFASAVTETTSSSMPQNLFCSV